MRDQDFRNPIRRWSGSRKGICHLTIHPSDFALTVEDTISSPVDLAEDLEKKIQWEKVSRIIEKMPNGREKEIIVLRYGLNNKKPLTQREIAQRLKISRSYVSRIEKKVLTDIKNEID